MVDKTVQKKIVAKPIAAPIAAAKAVTPPLAQPEAATPVPVVAKPLPVAAVAAAEIVPTAPAIKAPVIAQGKTTMNETINNAQQTAQNFTADATARAGEMLGDVSARAKTAMEKGSKTMEDMVEFSKGNIEAIVASGRVAAKGAQDIARYSAEYGRKSIEEANANARKFAAVKSPTEFFALQSEVAKSQLDALVGEASKFAEGYMKLLGEMAQPVQNRYAVAVEKVKTAVAA